MVFEYLGHFDPDPNKDQDTLCFFKENIFITSGSYECSYNQRNYLVFWKSVLITHVFITRFSYDVLISRVLISRVDCRYFYFQGIVLNLLILLNDSHIQYMCIK